MSIDTAVMTDVTRNADVDDYPRPPSLHWALVAVFWILTGGLFKFIWMYRQAAWVRCIDPSSKALWVLAAAFACAAVLPMSTLILGAGESGLTLTVVLVRLGFAVAWIWSYLSMRQSLEARFDLNLSGILTFFFTVFYLQCHMTSITKGEHSPYRPGLFLSAGLR
jgi:hypothetical protein